MKRFIRQIIATLLVATLCAMPTYASSSQNNDMKIPMEFLMESKCYTELIPSGETIVVLTRTKLLSSHSAEKRYETTTYSIYPDSPENIGNIMAEVSAARHKISARGSGSYSDEGWYHGQSLCISSTVNYSTTSYNGLNYGKITSVYVQCSVTNSTVLDSISLHIQQRGFPLGGGSSKSFDKDVSITNGSTTTTPSDWNYILWDATAGSTAGGLVTATVHRGTSGQYSYRFSNNVL